MKPYKILVVDDETSMLDFLDVLLTDEGYEIQCFLNPVDALEASTAFCPDIALIDVRMKPHNGLWLLDELKKNLKVTVVMMTAYIAVDEIVSAMKNGAYDYITKPFNINELRAVLRNAIEHTHRDSDPKVSSEDAGYGFDNFVGSSSAMRIVFAEIRKTAHLDSTILITGESGTGKELVARAIHCQSPRRNSPFISIDCSAIPETLLESELFGHMKGSFTGADKTKIGLFEAAGEGTVFLDEIAEMPIALQAKLLRVLQEREVRRIGSTSSVQIHARIISATNRNLQMDVREKRFREDLYFRLNIINIKLPRLIDRKEDIPLLVNHLFLKISKRLGKPYQGVSQDALDVIMKYHWPGNVRELENALERAMIMDEGSFIDVTSLPESLFAAKDQAFVVPSLGSLKESVEDFEKNIIKKTLDEMNGNQYKTARKLKLTRQSLQYKLKKYNLLKP